MIIILLVIDKRKRPMQLVDEGEEWVDINTNGEDNGIIEYSYNSLEDLISDSDGGIEDCLMLLEERGGILEERKNEPN